jgi:hypothetical protein
MSATRSPVVRPRSLVLLGAAATLAVAVVILVLVFGVARPPNLATLVEEPEPAPSASIVWIDRDGEEACLKVAAPDGAESELRCDRDLGEPIAWDADGVHVRSWDVWDEVRVFDAQTGEDVGQVAIDDPEAWDVPRSQDVVAHTRNGTLTVTIRATGQVVWEVDVGENYRVGTAVRSPDGAWVALLDSAERLLIVPADGSMEPRVWLDQVSTWDALVWEGTPVAREER